jgi:glycosyltransferase involved in cell wall biosynthesis
MLRVLQLIPTLDRSGAEKQMVLLAKGLPRDRFAVEVAALTRLGPLAADLQDAGIPVTLIGKTLKVDPVAGRRFLKFLRAGRFDVVHTWIFAANAHGRVASRMARVPVVITSEMAVDLWKSRAHLAIDRWLSRRTDRIVGNSQAVVDFYRDQAHIEPEKLALIRSGIGQEERGGPGMDADYEARRTRVREALGVGADAPVALFVGRLAAQKCVSDLLDAADLLQHIRPDLVTWIAGDGPDRMTLEARAGAFELLNSRVRFLGHRDDVPDLIDGADLLVLPSRYEGLPNVVLEAMMRGKPVVATAAPGTDEVVVDGETGRLVGVGDVKSLARALRDLADDPRRGAALGEAGRRRASEAFGLDRMVAEYADLYHDLARSKGLAV